MNNKFLTVLVFGLLAAGCAPQSGAPAGQEAEVLETAYGPTSTAKTKTTLASTAQPSSTVSTSTANGSSTPPGFNAGATTSTSTSTSNTASSNTTTSTNTASTTTTASAPANECVFRYINMNLPRTVNADIYQDLRKTLSCDVSGFRYIDTDELATSLALNGYQSYGRTSLQCYSSKADSSGRVGFTKAPEVESAWGTGLQVTCKPVFEKVRQEAGWYTSCHRGRCVPIYEGDISLIGQIRCCKQPVRNVLNYWY